MQVCPNCGEENPPRFRLCGFCGAQLQPDSGLEGEERKVVSVLFVDIVDFTARSHRSDPEDVVAALTPYQARLRQEIERFGGFREKFIGDAVVGVFGAPVAHEDDAERAVRAALSIIDAIEDLNHKNPSLELAVRAAVNTGEGLVSLRAAHRAGEGIVTGDVANTASRLQNIAPVGGVVVGELTYRSTRNSIVYEPLDPVTVKGKPDPLPVWRAISAHTHLGVERATDSTTPFIGRKYDLLALQALYHRALHERSVQLVTVVGEPGVGKSRLLLEFSSFVEQQPEQVVWRQGRCLPYGEGITFWPLSEIVKAQAGILESDGVEQASSKLDAAIEGCIEDTSEREWFKARLAPLVGAMSSGEIEIVDRRESFTAWRRFLETEATRAPLILVFEDLHWADPATVEFIEHLVEWSEGVPLFVICAARPELYDNHPGWGGGKHNSNTIGLSPLSDEETDELIASLLLRAAVSATIRSSLLERAGGNPLYAEEFARMIVERAAVNGAPFTAALDAKQIPFPETLHALIAARLDSLSGPQKAILQDASVAGRTFWAAAVAAIGGTEEVATKQALHELTVKELVRPARSSSMESQDEYSFWHALVREVAYGQIPRAARARKHLAMANWIEHIAADGLADRAEFVAHHYREALQLAKASGEQEEAERLELGTRRFLVMAGDRAAPLDAAKAARYYREALDLLPSGEPARWQTLVKASDVCVCIGEFGDSQRYLQEAIVGFRAAGDGAEEGTALAKLAKSLRDSGDTERARELLTAAIEVLQRQGTSDELSYAYVQLGGDALFSGSPEDAFQWADKALHLAEASGSMEDQSRALGIRGLARCELAEPEGIADLRRALEITKELDKPGWITTAYVALAYMTWLSEGPKEAEALYDKAIDIGDRRGVTGDSTWARAESVWPLFDLGKWDDVLTRTQEVVDWENLHGGSQMRAMTLPYKAAVILHRGRVAEALSLTEDFLPLARDIGDLQVVVPALAIGAAAHSAAGDHSTATRLIHELIERSRPAPSWRARFLPDTVKLLSVAGSLGSGAGLFLEGHRTVASRDSHSVVTARAGLAASQGRWEEAEAMYYEAAQRWERYGAVFERAQARLEGGRCSMRLGHLAEARTSFAEAKEVFVELAAARLEADVESALAELNSAGLSR
jgi:class 3 adenylate cyclase/tetratricopeptide (TPR) repeat protein